MRVLFAFALALILRAAPSAAGPVVVELFTSQGCSSCPDADRLLSTWGLREFQAGRVLPLSFNVDYWNYLGWRDVFSAPAWSLRQQSYAAALRSRTYTPQMVVAGRTAFVGSDAESASAAVRSFAGEKPRAALSLSVLPAAGLRLDVSAVPSPRAAGLHVMLAVFENGLETTVARGENGGRALRNDFVVRRLIDLGALTPGKTLRRRLDEGWDPAWNKKNAGAAVFLQDPESLAVYDAAGAFPLYSAGLESSSTDH